MAYETAFYELSVESVSDRLGQLGYTVLDEDKPQIKFEVDKITNYALNFCRLTGLPDIVKVRLIDRTCADFLYYKKNSGSLNGFNYDLLIRQIKEGDTSIQYAVGQGEDTPENRFDAFVKQLERGTDKWLTRFRRLEW